MDTNTPAADLRAVDDDVVGLGADVGGVGFELAEVFFNGAGEWVVQ